MKKVVFLPKYLMILILSVFVSFYTVGCSLPVSSTANDYSPYISGAVKPILRAKTPATSNEISAFADELSKKTTFNLNDVYLLILENSNQLKIAYEKIYQSQVDADTAINGMLPKVGIASKYTLQSQPITYGGIDFFPKTSFDYTLQIQEPLFIGLRDWYAYSQAKTSKEANIYAFERNKTMIYSIAAASFYGVIKAEKDLAAVKASKDRIEEHIKDARSRFEAGIGNKADLLRSEALLARMEAAVTSTSLGVRISKKNLSILTGISYRSILVKKFDTDLSKSNIIIPANADHDSLIQTAYNKRTDLLAAQKGVEALEKVIPIQRADLLPTVALRWDYYIENSGFQQDLDWALYGIINVPIFNFGTTDTKIRKIESGIREAKFGIESLKDRINAEVINSYMAYLNMKVILTAQKKQLDAATENYKIVTSQFNQGIATNLEVLSANEMLTSAKMELEKHIIDIELAKIKFLVSLGYNPAEPEKIVFSEGE